jgi:hypothetical protein
MLQLLTAILALYGSGLALPEVDPEPSAEEPFFDFDSRTMFERRSLNGSAASFLIPRAVTRPHPRMPMRRWRECYNASDAQSCMVL